MLSPFRTCARQSKIHEMTNKQKPIKGMWSSVCLRSVLGMTCARVSGTSGTSRPSLCANPQIGTNSTKEFSEQFEGGYRSLPGKTRVLRQIAPESSPERSAKSLSHSFFVVPSLSPKNVRRTDGTFRRTSGTCPRDQRDTSAEWWQSKCAGVPPHVCSLVLSESPQMSAPESLCVSRIQLVFRIPRIGLLAGLAVVFFISRLWWHLWGEVL